MPEQLIIEPAKVRGHRFLIGSQKLSSTYNPIKEGENLVAQYREKLKNTHDKVEVLALGFFPIYHLLFLHEISQAITLRVIEENPTKVPISSERLQAAWEVARKDTSSDLAFHSIIFYDRADQVIEFLKNVDSKTLSHMILVASPYTSKDMVTKIVKFYHQQREKSSIENRTIDYFQTLWNLHTLTNLKQCRGDFIASLKWDEKSQSATTRTAFLVSSGPSLDDTLEHHLQDLITLSKKHAIIAVPGVARRLLDLGVSLSAIIAVDAGFANTYHFSKLWSYRRTLPLVAPLTIHPGIPRHWEKNFFYWDMEEHHNFFSPTLGKKNYIPADASVVLSALRFLAKLGVNRIYTIGTDFSMTPFKEHALSNTTQEILFNQTERFTNYSTKTYKLYHQSHLSPTNSNDEDRYQSQALRLYEEQFEKIKTSFKTKGVEVTSMASFSWKEYKNRQGSKIDIRKHRHHSLHEIYQQESNHFKSQTIPVSEVDESPLKFSSPKEAWMMERWKRL